MIIDQQSTVNYGAYRAAPEFASSKSGAHDVGSFGMNGVVWL